MLGLRRPILFVVAESGPRCAACRTSPAGSGPRPDPRSASRACASSPTTASILPSRAWRTIASRRPRRSISACLTSSPDAASSARTPAARRVRAARSRDCGVGAHHRRQRARSACGARPRSEVERALERAGELDAPRLQRRERLLRLVRSSARRCARARAPPRRARSSCSSSAAASASRCRRRLHVELLACARRLRHAPPRGCASRLDVSGVGRLASSPRASACKRKKRLVEREHLGDRAVDVAGLPPSRRLRPSRAAASRQRACAWPRRRCAFRSAPSSGSYSASERVEPLLRLGEAAGLDLQRRAEQTRFGGLGGGGTASRTPRPAARRDRNPCAAATTRPPRTARRAASSSPTG